MDITITDFCEIELHDTFVILTVFEGELLTLKKATLIRKKLISYYGKKDFVMINDRKHNPDIDDEVYKQGQIPNMKGLAIVSQHKTERDKAIIEQKLFDKSFAFFEDLEEAKSWAVSHF